MSALCGETANLDHRAVLSELLFNRKLTDFRTLWDGMGWITCNECLWKTLVISVLKALSVDPREALGAVDKHEEYTKALKRYVIAAVRSE